MGEKINNSNRAEQKYFSSFEDFKSAVLTLPEDLLPLFLKKPNQLKIKRPSEITLLNFGLKGFKDINLPSDEEIKEEVENESSLSRIATIETALKELYEMTNGVMNKNTTETWNTIETSLKLFHEEIFSLWKNRGENEPIKIISFYAEKMNNKINSIKKELQELEEKIINAEKEKQEILNKTKIMGPKKKESYLKSRESELSPIYKIINTSADMKNILENNLKEIEKSSNTKIEKELLAKKMINARMPYLSGSEYFESYMNSLNHIFRYYSKAANKFEDVLLEWALKFQDAMPLKIQNKQEADIKQNKQIAELNSLQKKLLNELWRVYPVIEQNQSEDNLQHGSLIFQNLLRILKK